MVKIARLRAKEEAEKKIANFVHKWKLNIKLCGMIMLGLINLLWILLKNLGRERERKAGLHYLFKLVTLLGGESENKSSCLDGDDDGCRVRVSEDDRNVVVWDTKRVLIGAGARVLYYPTLVYKVVLFLFPVMFLRLKELGVHGVITLNEPYETLVPTSLYHAHSIYHLVLPTRDYLFGPSLSDISQAVVLFIVKHKQMTPEDAYSYVRSIRPRVRFYASFEFM
ncbi:putative dual specificity protein phosphatase DSP8 [Bienertia sinuspersici]